MITCLLYYEFNSLDQVDKTKIMRFILYADDKNKITLSNFFDYIEFSIQIFSHLKCAPFRSYYCFVVSCTKTPSILIHTMNIKLLRSRIFNNFNLDFNHRKHLIKIEYLVRTQETKKRGIQNGIGYILFQLDLPAIFLEVHLTTLIVCYVIFT